MVFESVELARMSSKGGFSWKSLWRSYGPESRALNTPENTNGDKFF